MIKFPCKCGYAFELPDDQAGGLVQCPQCGLLRDVPSHSDRQAITEDGTYMLEPPPLHDPEALADMVYVYQRGARDTHGNEIDLRLSEGDLDAVGGEPIPLAPDAPPREQAPRYNPETGELVTPIELQSDPEPHVNPASIPMARATINYASGDAAVGASLWRGLIRMFSPINIAVMLAIFCMHVLFMPLIFLTLVGIFFFVISLPFIPALILAHYGNVIEDAGPMGNDELPRPLRDLQFYEDIWSPFVGVFGSFVICYGPGIALGVTLALMPKWQPIALGVVAAGCGVGTFFLPAVLLTLQTSGTILNLRPDRVFSLIAECGFGYFFAVVLWIITAAVYLLGFVGSSAGTLHSALQASFLHLFIIDVRLPDWMTSWPVVLPALATGIFLMHYFCHSLGLLYRAHSLQFPWVLQRHVSTPSDPQAAESRPTGFHAGVNSAQPPRRMRPSPPAARASGR